MTDSSEGFWTFFEKHVNGWIASAMVLPTAITWVGIPMYEQQRTTLVAYAPLFCALILAFLFTNRTLLLKISRAKSRVGSSGSLLIPLVLICATGYCAYEYHQVLLCNGHYVPSLPDAMKSTALDKIRNGMRLMILYILTMVFAECAFFFMAIREWQPSSIR
jgi:hypothetical protein